MQKDFSQRLKEVLFLLASESNVQISAFPDFVHIPDEIASETSDAIEYGPSEMKQADMRIINALRNIDAIFDKMAGDASSWTIDSMRVNPMWQHVRLLAQEEISEQRLNYKRPELFWLSYVPG